MRTIKEQWDTFEKIAMPANAGPAQRKAMKRTFYAGAHVALNMSYATATDKKLSNDAATAIVRGMHEECERFALEVIFDRA